MSEESKIYSVGDIINRVTPEGEVHHAFTVATVDAGKITELLCSEHFGRVTGFKSFQDAFSLAEKIVGFNAKHTSGEAGKTILSVQDWHLRAA